MDLKALLVEAKQKVPPVLQVLQTGDETMLDIGGEFFKPIPVPTDANIQPFLTHLILVSSQERGAVHSAVVLAIVSQIVPSWRPCRPSRSPTLGGKTTWLIAQWTFKSFK